MTRRGKKNPVKQPRLRVVRYSRLGHKRIKHLFLEVFLEIMKAVKK